MTINKLPSRFVRMIPTQEQIDKDKTGTEALLNHLMQSFNLFRVKEECIQNDVDNNQKDEGLCNELNFIREKLSQIADMLEYALPGIVQDEINDEARHYCDELREIEIKKNALISKIIKLGSYTS